MQLTNNVLSFIEEIASKYKLDDFLMEDDALLKDILASAEPYKRLGIKIVFSKKLKTLVLSSRKSLDDILPSMKLKNIIVDIINKKISFNDLSQIIQEKMNLNLSEAEEISNAIHNNKDIIFLIENPTFQENISEEEVLTEKNFNDTKGTKSIGYEFLK